MRKNLDERERLFGELVPWDHANYGTDASWVRCFPYTQTAKAGDNIALEVVVTNHSTKAVPARCRAVLPSVLAGEATAWVDATIPAKTEGQLPIRFDIPSNTPPGRYVVPVDVKYGAWDLPQFAEAILDIA